LQSHKTVRKYLLALDFARAVVDDEFYVSRLILFSFLFAMKVRGKQE
jgi:hypothetical protein